MPNSSSKYAAYVRSEKSSTYPAPCPVLNASSSVLISDCFRRATFPFHQFECNCRASSPDRMLDHCARVATSVRELWVHSMQYGIEYQCFGSLILTSTKYSIYSANTEDLQSVGLRPCNLLIGNRATSVWIDGVIA